MFQNKVIYQIYPKSFLDTTGSGIGDLNGIRQKLSYLAELGVDYIWLSPINASPQYDNGYDIADYDHIDPMFGSDEDYLALIKEAKAKDIKVMMDLVLNHTSDQHLWFQKALQNDPVYRDFYVFRDEPNELQSFFGGSAWTYAEGVGKYYLHFFDPHQPDLNWDNPQVRQELYAMVNRWLAAEVEGFRLDVIDLIGKEPDRYISSKGPKFYEYLAELHEQTFKDHILTVGECWGASFEESRKMCTKGLTQIFHFHHLMTTNGKTKWEQNPLQLAKLADVLLTWQNDYEGIEALVMNNHDSPRLPSLWLDDQTCRKQSAKLLITLFGLLKGNLYLYQGEEIGMTNAHQLDLNFYRDVETFNFFDAQKEAGVPLAKIMRQIALISRDNARTPMQWTSGEHAGFTAGTPWIAVNENYPQVNVEDDLNSKDSVYRYYQQVIAFRKTHGDLLQEALALKVQGEVLFLKKGTIRGYFNMSQQKPELSGVEQARTVLFSNYEDRELPVSKQGVLALRPYEVVVYTV